MDTRWTQGPLRAKDANGRLGRGRIVGHEVESIVDALLGTGEQMPVAIENDTDTGMGRAHRDFLRARAGTDEATPSYGKSLATTLCLSENWLQQFGKSRHIRLKRQSHQRPMKIRRWRVDFSFVATVGENETPG